MKTILTIIVAAVFFLFGCSARTGVTSGYKSMIGTGGGYRDGPHAGVDFGGRHGDPIIAAAPGPVFRVFNSTVGCGKGVSINHRTLYPVGRYYTVYCHMSRVAVHSGQRVKRGEVIGYVGISGESDVVPHVHFEVSRDGYSHGNGDTAFTDDPFRLLVGCFDPQATYPEENLVLTKPLACTGD